MRPSGHTHLSGALAFVLFICFAQSSYAGYRTFLDPRSMAMGGTGVASATKFNASNHNPALIAFNRGDRPDKIYLSISQGIRETEPNKFENTLQRYQDSDIRDDFLDAIDTNDVAILNQATDAYREQLRGINLESYRRDETTAFSLLVDTLPVTLNFYTREDIREMTTIHNNDEALFAGAQEALDAGEFPEEPRRLRNLNSRVSETHVDITEFGVTVATTNVLDYNVPISWGFTPKLQQIQGAHRALLIDEYDIDARPELRSSEDFLEWNLDLGFAALLTDDFLREVVGLDGGWLEGEWVFAFVGKNMFPTDFTPFRPPRGSSREYPGGKRAIQAMYAVGLALYREKYMLALDLELNESEVFAHEGMTRFVSFGGEYYLRDNLTLLGGLRGNVAQTSGAGQDKLVLTGGLHYQLGGFSLEASGMFNDVEVGGTVGIGLAF